jgi:hypothetical protein
MSSNKPPFHPTPLSKKLHAVQSEGRVLRKKTKKKVTIYSFRDKGMEVAMERRRLARGKTTSTSR